MNRITRTMLESRVARLAQLVGKSSGTPWTRLKNKNVATIGCWVLDHNSIYGGYIIEETVNESGGVKHPLLSHRVSASELWDALYAAERAVELYMAASLVGAR